MWYVNNGATGKKPRQVSGNFLVIFRQIRPNQLYLCPVLNWTLCRVGNIANLVFLPGTFRKSVASGRFQAAPSLTDHTVCNVINIMQNYFNFIFSCRTANPVPPAGLNYIEINAEDFNLEDCYPSSKSKYSALISINFSPAGGTGVAVLHENMKWK